MLCELTNLNSTEIIADVEGMVYKILGRHSWWKKNHEWRKINFPKRIIYYRAGVSGEPIAAIRL